MDTHVGTLMNPKRKKRKTRKCLNEMRKRSRHNVETNGSSPNGLKLFNYITNNRLTLPMFPNVIRSETATRCSYPESPKHKQAVGIQADSDNKIDSTVKLDSSPFYPDSNKQRSKIYGERIISTHTLSDSDSGGDSRAGAGSALFSPPRLRTPSASPGLMQDSDRMTMDSTPSPSSTIDQAYHLYEEFMNEIPEYIEDNFPLLNREDTMKKTKIFLHNTYLDVCRKECEKNILQCMKNGRRSALDPAPAPTRPRRELPPSPLRTPHFLYYPHRLN